MLNWDTNTAVRSVVGGNGHSDTDLASEQRVEPRVETRNTLFIGLGGTGQRTGLYLKATFLNQFGYIPDWLRIVVFDTANEPLVVRLKNGKDVSLEPGTEFVNMGQVPVGRIIRHREQQKAITERFGESLLRLPPTVLRHGAKQERLLGLLALYWHYHSVEDNLRRAIWHLAGRDNRRRDVVDVEQGLNVFIVNSLCGGTGAGTFLDVAFLVRALVDELGDLSDFCQITGVGVLPGAFPDVTGPYMLPNTVASLMELNHVMTHNDFEAGYPNGRAVAATAAPFNLYYVLDGVDERGRVWPGTHAVCQLASHALYLQMGSQLGRKGENDFDNLDEIISEVTPDGIGTFMGSLGLSVCRFDGFAAHHACASHHARRLIHKGWLRPGDETTTTQTVAAFWDGQQLEPESLLRALMLDKEGVPITVDLALPGQVRHLPMTQQAQEAIGYVEDFGAIRVRGTFRTVIETQRQERMAALTTILRERVAQMAGDPDVGIPQTQGVLAALQNRLDQAWADLQTRREDLEVRSKAQESEFQRRREALLRTSTGSFLLRNSRITAALQQYLQAAAAFYHTTLQCDLCDAAIQILEGVSRTRRELGETLQQLATRLQEAARLLEGVEANSAVDLAADVELLHPGYINTLYRQYAPALTDTALKTLGDDVILAWANRPARDLSRTILEKAAEGFEALRKHGVEKALAEQAEDVSPQARRLLLLERAAPSWNLDRSRLEDGGASLVSLTVLGVPDEHNTLFAAQGGALVSTKDPNRIIALRVTVGAPYTALQQFPAWQRAYDDNRGQRLLHVLPSFHTNDDSATQAFALGLVFKLLYTQGSWYYYRPVDRLDDPLRLAQGLQNAMQVFTAREGLAREVLERVERQILVRLTTHQAIERLEAYYVAGEQADKRGDELDGLDRRLRKAARDYAARLREMLAASEGILA